jgi:uncharacterized Zn finger protein
VRYGMACMIRWSAMIKIEKKDRDAVKITISKDGRSNANPVAHPTRETVAEKGDKSFTFHGSSTIRTSATPLKAR